MNYFLGHICWFIAFVAVWRSWHSGNLWQQQNLFQALGQVFFPIWYYGTSHLPLYRLLLLVVFSTLVCRPSIPCATFHLLQYLFQGQQTFIVFQLLNWYRKCTWDGQAHRHSTLRMCWVICWHKILSIQVRHSCTVVRRIRAQTIKVQRKYQIEMRSNCAIDSKKWEVCESLYDTVNLLCASFICTDKSEDPADSPRDWSQRTCHPNHSKSRWTKVLKILGSLY